MVEPQQKNISVTVGLPAVTVFDVRGGVKVNKGVSFTLKLENFNNPLEWFADNDAVLDIKVSADTKTATITALESGDSEIEVQFRKSIIKIIKVVVAGENATTLNLTADPPQPKT